MKRIYRILLVVTALAAMSLATRCTYMSFDDHHNQIINEKTVDKHT